MAKKETAARPRSTMSPEDFVALWQSAETLVEVGEKYDLGQAGAQSRATRYRRAGIELKMFPRGYTNGFVLDVEVLNKLAKKSLKKAS